MVLELEDALVERSASRTRSTILHTYVYILACCHVCVVCVGGDARVADAGHGKEHETQMPQEEHQTHRASDAYASASSYHARYRAYR